MQLIMKRNLSHLLIAVVLFVAFSCSKEKRFEHMLYKGNGEWEIVSITYTLITEDENSQTDTFSGTVENAGTFEFEKDGRGSYNFIISNTIHHEGFNWETINDTGLNLSRDSEKYDLFTGYTEYILIAMTAEKTEKNKMTVTGTEIHEEETDYGYIYSDLTATITLEKK